MLKYTHHLANIFTVENVIKDKIWALEKIRTTKRTSRLFSLTWGGGGLGWRGKSWLLGWMRPSGLLLLSPSGLDKETQRGTAKATLSPGRAGFRPCPLFYTQVATPCVTLTLAKRCVACRASFHGDRWEDSLGSACFPPPYSVFAQPGELSKP